MCVLTLKISHRPDGKIADALALILACTSANDASINYRLCVPQRLQKFPSPMGDSHVLRLCLQGGGVHVQGGSVTFDSCTITGNTAEVRGSKVPIAPMGKCLVDMSIRFSSLMMWVLPRCTSLEYVPSAPETSKVPIAPMGDSCFACFYRAAVSMSIPAPSQ